MTKHTWDLSVLYSSLKDPQLEKDVVEIEHAYESFARMYKEKVGEYSTNPDVLLTALKDYEKMIESLNGGKPGYYIGLLRAIEMNNTEAEALSNVLGDRLTKAGNKILFFELGIGKIKPELQKEILSRPDFLPYKYLLEKLFATAKYDLSEPEEKILSLKSQPARGAWIEGVEKLISKQTVKWGGKEVPISEASNMIASLPKKKRDMLHTLIMQKLQGMSDFAESEINAIYSDKKINDELRGLEKPYTSRLLGDEMEEETLSSLIRTVSDNYHISHRFMKLKAKLLKLKKLSYADRLAGIGSSKEKVSFEQAVRMTKNAFAKANPLFADILQEFLDNKRIDVYPRKHKTGGAFCAGDKPLPTYVLLNHTPDPHSISTLAHEMGHAIHTELSAHQPVFYRGYSTATAEVASTFFESIAFDTFIKNLPKKEKIIALHDRLNDSISTIFRQIAVFNFELELHNRVRKEGFVPKEEIAKMLNHHMSLYLGPVVKMEELDGYFFVKWSHIRNSFYVYTYAYGEIVSKALYARYKKDNRYIEKVEQFLKAGGSKSPQDIFKEIGINTADKNFFLLGLKEIESEIEELEKLCNNGR